MKDKCKFDYIEAAIFYTCAVCDLKFYAFPDMDNPIFECLGCNRMFSLEYKINPLSNLEMIKQKLKMESNIKKKEIIENERIELDI